MTAVTEHIEVTSKDLSEVNFHPELFFHRFTPTISKAQ